MFDITVYWAQIVINGKYHSLKNQLKTVCGLKLKQVVHKRAGGPSDLQCKRCKRIISENYDQWFRDHIECDRP